MVNVTYITQKGEISVSHPKPTFYLTNNKGGYYYQALHSEFSHYCGFFLSHQTHDSWDMYKYIHYFGIVELPKDIIAKKKTTLFKFAKGDATYFVQDNILDVKTTSSKEFSLLLDCRARYDFGSFGKEYNYSFEDDLHVFTFTKDANKISYVVIKTQSEFTRKEEWIEQNFELEKKRNTQPQQFWVYNAGFFKSSKKSRFIIACGQNKEQVKSDATSYRIKNSDEKAIKEVKTKQLQAAFEFSIQSINDLYQNHHNQKGLYAGLPWFTDYWTRDEAISLGAFIALKEYDVAKELLLRELTQLHEDGRIANRLPHSDLGSADGIGWCAKRLYDLFKKNQFTQEELLTIRRTLAQSYLSVEKNYMKDGLIYSRPLETWMDTGDPYDTREGCCIEIQTLHLIQLKLINEISEKVNDNKYTEFTKKEFDLLQQVKKILVTHVVNDRYNDKLDKTVRPNVFIAYYVYREIADPQIWKETFTQCLGELWQDWGGISTISKNHELYKDTYMGQTNQSYHRGDVWYWLNCLSAICLSDFDEFQEYVQKIISASETEILSRGAIGRHSEVSDAKQLSSHGCQFQLWSSALFVELLEYLNK